MTLEKLNTGNQLHKELILLCNPLDKLIIQEDKTEELMYLRISIGVEQCIYLKKSHYDLVFDLLKDLNLKDQAEFKEKFEKL